MQILEILGVMTFQLPVQPYKTCNGRLIYCVYIYINVFLGDDRQVAAEVHLSRACVGSL